MPVYSGYQMNRQTFRTFSVACPIIRRMREFPALRSRIVIFWKSSPTEATAIRAKSSMYAEIPTQLY